MRKPSDKILWLAAFIFGLGLTNYQVLLLAAVPLAIIIALRNIRLFDIYRGTGIAEGKKSMAFSLELRADDRTLTDTDSEGVVTKVLTALKEKLGVELR